MCSFFVAASFTLCRRVFRVQTILWMSLSFASSMIPSMTFFVKTASTVRPTDSNPGRKSIICFSSTSAADPSRVRVTPCSTIVAVSVNHCNDSLSWFAQSTYSAIVPSTSNEALDKRSFKWWNFPRVLLNCSSRSPPRLPSFMSRRNSFKLYSFSSLSDWKLESFPRVSLSRLGFCDADALIRSSASLSQSSFSLRRRWAFLLSQTRVSVFDNIAAALSCRSLRSL